MLEEISTLTKKQDNLSKDYLIVKGNIFNESKIGNITLVEYRLLLIALSKISPLMDKLDFICFSSNDFCNLLNLQKRGMYTHIKKAAKDLASRTLTIEDKQKRKGRTFAYLEEIKYDESNIMLKFHANLEEHILNIRKKGGYTKYFIKNILNLKSLYSVRIYELLKQYENLGKRSIDLTKLKELVGATNKSYNKISNFRLHVLNKSIQEINILTDITINFEEIKEGRAVKTFLFYIKSKKEITDFKTKSKDKLILEIQNNIYKKCGYIFEAKHMNDLHRIILIDLLNKFYNDSFNKIFIRNPNQFFIYQLNEIKQNYDIDKMNKKFPDY
jgi:plasmid replication initiation protein